jgi:hypothetical protein
MFATFVVTSCCKSDTSLFMLHNTLGTAYLLLYVDNTILTASSTVLLECVITTLNSAFAMTDMGNFHYPSSLGITVSCISSTMFLSQQKYAAEILDRTDIISCKPSSMPIDTTTMLATTAGSPSPIPRSTIATQCLAVLHHHAS